MPSVLSEREYNQIYRLLSEHHDNNQSIINSIRDTALPQLKSKESFLDIGPGTGYITNAIRPFFKTSMIIEPSPEFSNHFASLGYATQTTTLQNAELNNTYDYVLCSHVLYNVELSEWPSFLDKLISSISPGGMATIVMSAARGRHHEICHSLNAAHKSSAAILHYLKQKNINHVIECDTSYYDTKTFEEMVTLCRFTLLEDCYTAEKYLALNEDGQALLNHQIISYANSLKQFDGSYRLTAEVDYIHITN